MRARWLGAGPSPWYTWRAAPARGLRPPHPGGLRPGARGPSGAPPGPRGGSLRSTPHPLLYARLAALWAAFLPTAGPPLRRGPYPCAGALRGGAPAPRGLALPPRSRSGCVRPGPCFPLGGAGAPCRSLAPTAPAPGLVRPSLRSGPLGRPVAFPGSAWPCGGSARLVSLALPAPAPFLRRCAARPGLFCAGAFCCAPCARARLAPLSRWRGVRC